MRILTWVADQIEAALIRIATVTAARPVEYPKIVDRRETSRGEPHTEECGK